MNRRAEMFRNPVIYGAPGDDHGDPFVIKYLDSFYLYHSGETTGRRGIDRWPRHASAGRPGFLSR